MEIWQKIPDQFSYVALDEFVVMPDHFHGIVLIRKDAGISDAGGDAINRVCTDPDENPQGICDDQQKNRGGVTGDKNPMLHENLSRVIRWFKGRASFEIRKIEPGFAWHERFHESIIRDDEALQKIRRYIRENPEKVNK